MKEMNLTELEANGLDVRNEIRRERRVELALEGQRYFDILRWKEGSRLALDVKGMKKSFIANYNQQYVAAIPTDENGYLIINSNRQFLNDKNYLWPVPLNQLERNPSLGQNPNW